MADQATAGVEASEFTLPLTEEERVHLLGFLELALRDKRVEVRRTEAPDYRKHVRREEAVLEGLIGKLR
jgi:hypothetical protein